MGLVFLFVRIVVGGFFAWRGVRYLDPYARHIAIVSARARGWRGSDLVFVTLGLMMLVGGISIVMGIAQAVGGTAAVMALAIDATWRFKNIAKNRGAAFAFARRWDRPRRSCDAARALSMDVFIHRPRRHR